VTNIPTHDDAKNAQRETVVDVEAWFRRRTDIEDRIREAKLGAALRHLPSGHAAVNAVWMWAALLAGNLSVLLQALTGIDDGGRAHVARLHQELLCVPARIVRHGRRIVLRLPPGSACCPRCWPRSENCTSRPDRPAPTTTTKLGFPSYRGDIAPLRRNGDGGTT
ncbi:MAG TPA: transposase, partial [Nocardioidaceae bacterium]|nr:transposase [Nocardioidaceae bacterium]